MITKKQISDTPENEDDSIVVVVVVNNDYGHWSLGDGINSLSPEDWFGFIYLIRHRLSGKGYIGRKQFSSKKRVVKNKKSKSCQVESDWKTYCSSSETIKEDVKSLGKDQFDFIILQLCSGKCELTYNEERLQYVHNVLLTKLADGSKAYYNKTIGFRHYAGIEKQSETSKRKLVPQHSTELLLS